MIINISPNRWYKLHCNRGYFTLKGEHSIYPNWCYISEVTFVSEEWLPVLILNGIK